MCRKIASVWVSILLIFGMIVIFVDLPVVSAVDLIIGDDEYEYFVSGTENWDNITVLGTGKLIVPSGTILNASNIFLQGTSVVEISSATINMKSPVNASDISFNGTCAYFNMTEDSILNMRASDGYADTSSFGPYNAYIPVSMGGDAILKIHATQELQIENSIINVTGGNGFDLPPSNTTNCNAWTSGVDIDGYIAAGGNATVSFTLTSMVSSLIIDNLTLNALGGDGGDAADGAMKYGGGYGNGGAVSDYVGSGGNSTIDISSKTDLILKFTKITSNGGRGGDAGDGGGNSFAFNDPGGGGGGYGGGNGGNYQNNGEDGGLVSENVGCGGTSKIEMNASNVLIENSNLTTIGGSGGDAGDGGRDSNAGNGGGGYGGGGGSGRSGATVKTYISGKGTVSGFVGFGGNSTIIITAQNSINIINSNLSAHGGNGGKAGDGGGGTSGYRYGGGGGGGYAGGAGAGGGSKLCTPQNASVSGMVGSGGNSVIHLQGTSVVLTGSIIYIDAGGGGDGGDAMDLLNYNGGGGGAGYGGGGGGCYSYGGPGANTNVSGNIGCGGFAKFSISVTSMKILSSRKTFIGGDGGNEGKGGGADLGGGGGGGYGGGGGGGRWDDGNSDNDQGGHGGNTFLSGRIGVGNDANITLDSTYLEIRDSLFFAKGGKGGNAGIASPTSDDGGGGGGGYGGCGGGGRTDTGSGRLGIGGKSTMSGSIGDGGGASIYIQSQKSRTHIANTTNFNVSFGIKGNGSRSRGLNGLRATGGDGRGYNNLNGSAFLLVPMSTPLLFSPEDNAILNYTPEFNWLSLHNSSTNNPLISYTIQIDNDITFSSPEIINITTLGNYIPSQSLPEGTYFWRVKANYSLPFGSSAGWSEVWKFTISFIAPIDLKINVNYLIGEITLTWISPLSPTLDHYIIYRSSDPHNFNFSSSYNKSLTWPDPLSTSWIDPDSGAGSDDVNYFYIVHGVNITGYEEQNLNIVGKHVSWLDYGWSLISIPLKPFDTSLDLVFSTISGSYNIIQWHDLVNGRWMDSDGALTDVDNTMGLWIHMKNSAKLITNGSLRNSLIHLTNGWNLVGYPSFYEPAIDLEFSDVPAFESAQYYNSSDDLDHWKHYNEVKSFGNDLSIMKAGRGYWVYVSSDSDWIVEY
jgi:hypothetical protein